MKKLLLIAAILAAFTLNCSPRAAAPAEAVLIPNVLIQDTGAAKNLGDGFQSKTRIENGKTYLLVHFPASAYLHPNDEASDAKFEAALNKALGKVFGQDYSFAEAPDGSMQIAAGKELYSLSPLYETADGEAVVGIVLRSVRID